VPGLRSSLRTRVASKRRIRCFFKTRSIAALDTRAAFSGVGAASHDAPVGAIVEAKEDRRGLWIKAELPKDDDFVRGRLVPLLKRRGLKGMSIGYRVMPGGSSVRKEDGARLLKESRLFECSLVSLPMHPDAGLETIKADALDGADALDAIRALRDVFQLLSVECIKARADLAPIDAAIRAASVGGEYHLKEFVATMRALYAAVLR
jgi:HK97 family phage prohead protease